MRGKVLLFVGIFLLLAASVSAQSSPADTDNSDCVDIGEIVSYVDLWKNGQVTIQQVVAAVEVWQQGCNLGPVCGNNQCEAGETCNSCQQDCGTCGGGTGQTYLPASRSIDWSGVGIPGGIPFYPVSTTLSAGSTGSQIQSALNSAPKGTAVKLAPGTYDLGSTTVSIPSRVALRGSGVDATKILCARPGSRGRCFTIGDGFSGGSATSITGGLQRGSTQITVSSTSGFSPGDIMEIVQDNDRAFFSCGYKGCEDQHTWGARNMGQTNVIVSISGNTVTLKNPLYMNYNLNMNPEARVDPSPVVNAGIEDLRIVRTSQSGTGHNILFSGAVYSWVKNVWLEKALESHIAFSLSYGNEVRDTVFDGTWLRGTGGQGYGLRIESRSSSNLFENNIFSYLRHSMEISTGSSGNVFGYSFSIDPKEGSNSWLSVDISNHGWYPNMNLYEGNLAQIAEIDDTWGTSGPTTFFRNRLMRESAYIPEKYWKNFGYVKIELDNRYHNVIGNELGKPNDAQSKSPIWLTTSRADTILVHGNYNYKTGSVTKWESSLDNNLPDSLYLSGKPGWWDNSAWPPFGPEIAPNSGKTPAWKRFDALRAAGKI